MLYETLNSNSWQGMKEQKVLRFRLPCNTCQMTASLIMPLPSRFPLVTTQCEQRHGGAHTNLTVLLEYDGLG